MYTESETEEKNIFLARNYYTIIEIVRYHGTKSLPIVQGDEDQYIIS
jgi:hypothetical protein